MFKSPADKAANAAATAWASGSPVFTPKLYVGDPAAEIVAIEKAGWRLEHWAVGSASPGSMTAYPIFRRPQ